MIADLVIKDIEARKKLGMEHYGKPLLPFNGRDALQDAYEEALDMAIYLRQALEEKASRCFCVCHAPVRCPCCDPPSPSKV